ncbi:MAG: hypothetical protein LVR00_03370 [Rhabdochlamydiaceae bacterium]
MVEPAPILAPIEPPPVQKPEVVQAPPPPEPEVTPGPPVQSKVEPKPKPELKIGSTRPAPERRIFSSPNSTKPAGPKAPHVKPPMPAGFTPRSEVVAGGGRQYPSTYRPPGQHPYRPGGRPPFDNRPFSGSPSSRPGGRPLYARFPFPKKMLLDQRLPKNIPLKMKRVQRFYRI